MRGDSTNPYNSMGIEEVVQVLHRYLRNKNAMNDATFVSSMRLATNRFTKLFLSLVSRKNFKNDEEKRICFKIALKLSPHNKQLRMFFDGRGGAYVEHDMAVDRQQLNPSADHLLDLPDEMLLMIATHLHPKDQRFFKQICQRFSRIGDDLSKKHGCSNISWYLQAYEGGGIRSLILMLEKMEDIGGDLVVDSSQADHARLARNFLENVFGRNTIRDYSDPLRGSRLRRCGLRLYNFGAALPVHEGVKALVLRLFLLVLGICLMSVGVFSKPSSFISLASSFVGFCLFIFWLGTFCVRSICNPNAPLANRWERQLRNKIRSRNGISFSVTDVKSIDNDLTAIYYYLDPELDVGRRSQANAKARIENVLEKLKKMLNLPQQSNPQVNEKTSLLNDVVIEK